MTRVQKSLGGFPPNPKTNPYKKEGWGGVSVNPLLNFPAQNSAGVPPEMQSHMLTNGRAREWKEPGSWWLSLHGSGSLGCHSGLLMWETLILEGWICRQSQTICDNRTLIHVLNPGSQITIYSSGPRMVRILSRGDWQLFLWPLLFLTQDQPVKACISLQTNRIRCPTSGWLLAPASLHQPPPIRAHRKPCHFSSVELSHFANCLWVFVKCKWRCLTPLL